MFDTSDYPTDHPCHSVHNKKVLGKMKDKMSSIFIQEFVGRRAKSYSVLEHDNKETKVKKAKGVDKLSKHN